MHIIYLHKNIISIKYGLARENIRANTSGKCRWEDSSKPDHMIVSDTQTKSRVNTHTNIYIYTYKYLVISKTQKEETSQENTHWCWDTFIRFISSHYRYLIKVPAVFEMKSISSLHTSYRAVYTAYCSLNEALSHNKS